MGDPFPPLKELVDSSMRYTRGVERLRSCMVAIAHVETVVSSLAELDPDLAPELATVIEHLTEAVDALGRAHEFQNARYDTELKKLLQKEEE
jgi:hypothetical protein